MFIYGSLQLTDHHPNYFRPNGVLTYMDLRPVAKSVEIFLFRRHQSLASNAVQIEFDNISGKHKLEHNITCGTKNINKLHFNNFFSMTY